MAKVREMSNIQKDHKPLDVRVSDWTCLLVMKSWWLYITAIKNFLVAPA